MKVSDFLLTICYILSIKEAYADNNNKINNKEAHILSSDIQLKRDGSYYSGFSTSNGIKQEDYVAADGFKKGKSSYISPEGLEIKTTYVADENGYHPKGDYIPRIPDYIIRALEYIRLHPYVEKDYYTGEFKTPKIPTIPTPDAAAYQHLHLK